MNTRSLLRSCSFRLSSQRRSFRPSVPRNLPFAVRLWKLSNMNKVLLLGLFTVLAAHGQTATQIVQEAQNRARANSQRYEGTLKVVDAKNKITEKRWQYERIGSFGDSKALLRFTAPAEVKGVALLIVNHKDRASDQWMW